MKHGKFTRKRSKIGNAVAELPFAIWFFIICLCFPILGFITLGYRCTLIYFAVKDSCYQASKASDFGSAQTIAKTILQKDAAAWNGVKVPPNDPQVSIVVRKLSTGVETESGSAIPPNSINPSANMYLIRIRTVATIDPIVNMGTTGFWTGIPGLTGSFNIPFLYQNYAENPNGL